MFDVGIDLVDLEVLKEKMSSKLVHRLLSDEELLCYESITDETRKLTYLGGRFAAKEALFKAFKKGDKTANYRDFTILNDENGTPYFKENQWINGFVVKLSIAHTNKSATAIVMLTKNK